jgi:capsular polysaccharide export protein
MDSIKPFAEPTVQPLEISEGLLYVLDFPFWKRKFVRRFFPEMRLKFVSRLAQLPTQCTVLVWGMRYRSADFANGIRILRVEDGFIRSVGLGADLVQPSSWVIDDMGIYYDATQPSRLEHILACFKFSEDLLSRAEILCGALVSTGVTKYNVGSKGWLRPAGITTVILVPGQVESDASIKFGAPAPPCLIQRNMDLLRAVRDANPDAYIVYKPHPDVLAGLRLAGVDENQAFQWCNEQVSDISMGSLLGMVDEVHALTSLAGFEALLRGKSVTCYGQPFYAGWGLTCDIYPVQRRARKLTLPELVAGVLFEYPIYVSREDGRFISAEVCLSELIAWRNDAKASQPLWRKGLRWVLQQGRW